METGETTSQTPCPPLETIAAILDGRSSDQERDRQMAHIEECERCWEVFTETARYLLDERAVTEPLPGPGTAPRTARWRVATAAAAAVLALAVVVPVGYGLWREASGPPGVAELAASLSDDGLAAETAGLPGDRGWSRVRGVGSVRPPQQSAFRLGVLLIDLDRTLAAGADERALALLSEIGGLARGYPAAGDLLWGFVRIEQGLAADESPSRLRRWNGDAASAVGEAVGAHRPEYLLGAWAEAGRYAAASEDRAYFRGAERRRLEEALGPETLPEELRPGYRALRARLAELSDEAGFGGLEAAFDDFIERAGNL